LLTVAFLSGLLLRPAESYHFQLDNSTSRLYL